MSDFLEIEGKRKQAIKYKPDFTFYEDDKLVKVVDVKGKRTETFNIKAKMFMKRYGIPLILAKHDYKSKMFDEKMAQEENMTNTFEVDENFSMKNVNSPSHYNANGIETIVLIENVLTPEEFEGYLKGNTIKYLAREKHKHKDRLLDVSKASWHTNKLVDFRKKGQHDAVN